MELASPQTFNRYAYCNSDPVNKVDPAGLMLSDIGVYQTWNPQAARGLDYQSVINHTYAQNLSRQQQARQTVGQQTTATFVRGTMSNPALMDDSSGSAEGEGGVEPQGSTGAASLDPCYGNKGMRI
jgi:hypothetical protein